MKRRDPFQAIADPTRRSIISMVAKESLNLNSVAERFDVSRPAISKHIKILTQCGLITIRQKGRERFCEATLEPLADVSSWLESYKVPVEIRAEEKEQEKAVIKQVEDSQTEVPAEINIEVQAEVKTEEVVHMPEPIQPSVVHQQEPLRHILSKKKKITAAPTPDIAVLQGSLFG